jgi:Arc/MetJ-type ribon-helix-helix transcriptional regulator
VELGVFKDESEAVNVAVKKMLANQSREYLRDLAKRKNITKKELLAEWEKTRN